MKGSGTYAAYYVCMSSIYLPMVSDFLCILNSRPVWIMRLVFSALIWLYYLDRHCFGGQSFAAAAAASLRSFQHFDVSLRNVSGGQMTSRHLRVNDCVDDWLTDWLTDMLVWSKSLSLFYFIAYQSVRYCVRVNQTGIPIVIAFFYYW